ncbi:hypothetical protein AMS68_007195 [Peltaster fructicola]|uniref:Peptidase A1 domain-containing protein n=1 Tax=Peltaster fructicola TaxID=286661 RepID=A0A6H0Y4B1_9PEZI|nr:hypothetical protein AMS68_007195 [Peltaster fructicola]
MFYPIMWSATTYGLDGPWHAISAAVGGYDNAQSYSQSNVDLLPGGIWESYILSNATCTSNATVGCASGGFWDPLTSNGGSLAQQTMEGPISVEGDSQDQFGSGRHLHGKYYAQNLHFNGRGVNNYPGITIPNSTLVSATSAYHTWPNGRVTSLEIGNLALGADGPTMTFGTKIATYNVPGYLGTIPVSGHGIASNSYAMHIGSTALSYPGSLIFGAYDKGRGLGPVTSWSGNKALMLRDITLGVETGGSPWNFSSKTGLLLNNQSQPSSLPVYPDGLAPYLHLPDATCKGLAQVLPIYFDQTSKFYLWNTSDPAYTKVVTSAAYLGFVFPSVTVGQDAVTIKVPMMYLNLTLMPLASGLTTPVQYFPCQNYNPNYGSLSTGGSDGGTYILGRSFLQAAILGRNWAQGISWLAQAPGPGPNREGLGYNPVEIQNNDTSISFDTDTSLFNKSMQGYWTPLPQLSTADSSSSGSGSGSGTSSSSTQGTNAGLSIGAKIGIGLGAALVTIVLIGLVVLLLLRRKRSKKSTELHGAPSLSELTSPDSTGAYAARYHGQPYRDQYGRVYYVKYAHEMSGHDEVKELADHRLEVRELHDRPLPPQELEGK